MTTWFEELFRDHPVVRDLVLVCLLVVGFGVPFRALFRLAMPVPIRIPPAETLGIGLAFAVPWLVLTELWARQRGTSILRSIGDDPLEKR